MLSPYNKIAPIARSEIGNYEEILLDSILKYKQQYGIIVVGGGTMETKYTKEDLKIMQSWSLERKIQVTQTRIMEYRKHFDGKVYVSFSGGKDSTVLSDLTARIYSSDKIFNENKYGLLTLVFVNTGLEYPEIQKFVLYFSQWLRDTYDIEVNLEILYPKMNFIDVIKKYGYPVIGKEVSKAIYYARKGTDWGIRQINGLNKDGTINDFRQRFVKYKFLLDALFECSSMCCNIMKKEPAKKYNKKSKKYPIIATTAEESSLRETNWLKNGCNSFDSKNPKSNPMSFWTEQDILKYIKDFNIPISPVYGDIVEENGQTTLFEDTCKLKTTGCDRTGCMYCMFGIMSEKEPNRFQRMKKTHPKQYEYCINGGHYEDGILKPDKNGLGIGKILDYLGIPY